MSALEEAIKLLHRQKDEAYRGAWKRRGELFSVIPNIARKVDRLAAIIDGASNLPGETILDTAIDLHVYCIKYTLFLADSDRTAAAALQLSGRRPFSDNHENFDQVMELVEIPARHSVDIRERIRDVSGVFEELWPAVEAGASKTLRFNLASTLMNRSERLLAAIVAQHPEAVDAFVASIRSEN